MNESNAWGKSAAVYSTGTAAVTQPAHRVLRNTYALLALSMLAAVAGALLGIQLLDHVIVTKTGYSSMKERGLL